MFARKSLDSSEVRVNLLIRHAEVGFEQQIPVELTPAGMTNERQKYLYEHVHPYVRLSCQDLVCPEPEN